MSANNSQIKTNQRDQIVDIFRGLAILLIMFGHSLLTEEIYNFTYLFHLSLFFYATGFFISKKSEEKQTLKYIGEKIFRFYRIYFISLVLYTALIILMHTDTKDLLNSELFINLINAGIFADSNHLKEGLYSLNFWFLPTFALYTSCLFILFKYSRKYLKEIFLVLFVIATSILIINSNGRIVSDDVPWGVDKLPLLLLMGILGDYFYRKFHNLQKVKWGEVLIAFGILLTGVYFKFDIRAMMIPNIFLFLFYSFFGLFITYNFAIAIKNTEDKKIKGFLNWLGRNSIGLYIVHSFVFPIIHNAMGYPENGEFHLVFNISAIITSIGIYSIIHYVYFDNNRNLKFINN